MNNDEPKYTISNAARLADISVHTLRMYERKGLIIPFKKESNQRLYSDEDIERVKCIRKTINDQKITIEGIRHIFSLLPCWAILKCSKKEQNNCEAYSGSSKACWMYKHKGNICEQNNCRECEVYKDISDCNSLKARIKSLIL